MRVNDKDENCMMQKKEVKLFPDKNKRRGGVESGGLNIIKRESGEERESVVTLRWFSNFNLQTNYFASSFDASHLHNLHIIKYNYNRLVSEKKGVMHIKMLFNLQWNLERKTS